MRILLALAITVSALLAFAVGCGDDGMDVQVTPGPASESEGEAEGWEAGDGAEEGEDGREPPLDAGDSDGDGFDDTTEEDLGSDPLDSASVPETEDINPGSCTDGVDNDLDGFADDADDGCFLVSATLDVTPRDSVGSCPVTLTASGTITLEVGSGTVSYQFVDIADHVISDGTLTFDSPGTQDVTTTWNRGHPAMASRISEWVVLRILEPEEHESNRANFTILCDVVEPEPCPDVDMDGLCDDDDDDDDGVSDADETEWGSDPFSAASTPESSDFDLATCHDGIDNDRDGFLDLADDGCV